jgi:hypothetical protein
VLGQELLDRGDRRLRRPGGHVPHQDERAARPEHACDLGKRALAVEPVERLGGEDGID